jgi:hypothetical protein
MPQEPTTVDQQIFLELKSTNLWLSEIAKSIRELTTTIQQAVKKLP